MANGFGQGLQQGGNVLQAIGADLQGRTSEFQRGQREERAFREQEQEMARQRQKEDEEQRKRAMFQDAAVLQDHLMNGRIDAAKQLVSQRKGLLQQLGATDTSDTDAIEFHLNDGNAKAVLDMVDPFVRTGQITGYLAETPVSKHIGFSDDKTQAIFQTPRGAVAQDIKGIRVVQEEKDKNDPVQSSKFMENGLIQVVRKSGASELIQPDEASMKVIRAAKEQSIQDAIAKAGGVTGEREKAKAGISKGSEAFDQVQKVTRSISNLDKAIAAVDGGAKTGAVMRLLPTVRKSSVELENVMNEMGLDIVGATTFGALSESELQFALDTALPTKLQGADLKDWLVRKKDAQSKLKTNLEDASIYLMRGGDIAGLLERNRATQREGGQIMVDAQGNRARVFPDGTFEEL